MALPTPGAGGQTCGNRAGEAHAAARAAERAGTARPSEGGLTQSGPAAGAAERTDSASKQASAFIWEGFPAREARRRQRSPPLCIADVTARGLPLRSANRLRQSRHELRTARPRAHPRAGALRGRRGGAGAAPLSVTPRGPASPPGRARPHGGTAEGTWRRRRRAGGPGRVGRRRERGGSGSPGSLATPAAAPPLPSGREAPAAFPLAGGWRPRALRSSRGRGRARGCGPGWRSRCGCPACFSSTPSSTRPRCRAAPCAPRCWACCCGCWVRHRPGPAGRWGRLRAAPSGPGLDLAAPSAPTSPYCRPRSQLLCRLGLSSAPSLSSDPFLPAACFLLPRSLPSALWLLSSPFCRPERRLSPWPLSVSHTHPRSRALCVRPRLQGGDVWCFLLSSQRTGPRKPPEVGASAAGCRVPRGRLLLGAAGCHSQCLEASTACGSHVTPRLCVS